MKRSLTCPQCGARVRIPWFWAIGIEGIFRCRQCRLPFKTGYKTGAILSADATRLSEVLLDGIRIQHLFNDFFRAAADSVVDFYRISPAPRIYDPQNKKKD